MIHGFQKLTLLDYPGKVAATVFLGECNFRCPFCQNSGLVLTPEKEPVIEAAAILKILEKRQGILDGVCITGGEPTLYKELDSFLYRIKKLGYAIKLDTNGYRPGRLRELVSAGLVDYVAMDIKHSKEKYTLAAGREHMNLARIEESVEFLMNGALEYEFRTTVCKGLHCESDFYELGKWLAGCKRYYLQGYQESEHVIRPGFSSYTKEEMECFAKILRHWIPAVEIRGVL